MGKPGDIYRGFAVAIDVLKLIAVFGQEIVLDGINGIRDADCLERLQVVESALADTLQSFGQFQLGDAVVGISTA